MLLVAFRESVSTGAVGHEIELLRARRIGGGLDRSATGVGNRSGRQAVDDVSVVGSGLRYLALGERMPERPLAEDETVDDGWIRLQFHLLLEPVRQHRRDARALLGLAAIPYFAHQPILRLAHALEHLLARESAVEMVAVG